MFVAVVGVSGEIHDDPTKFLDMMISKEHDEEEYHNMKSIVTVGEFAERIRNTIGGNVEPHLWGSPYYIAELSMYLHVDIGKHAIVLDYIHVKESERGKGHFRKLLETIEPLFHDAVYILKFKNVCPNLEVFFARRNYVFRKGRVCDFNAAGINAIYPSTYATTRPRKMVVMADAWSNMLPLIRRDEKSPYRLVTQHESSAFLKSMEPFLLRNHVYRIDKKTYRKLLHRRMRRLLYALGAKLAISEYRHDGEI